MRISAQGQSVDSGNPSSAVQTNTVQKNSKVIVETNSVELPTIGELAVQTEEQSVSKEKLKQAVDTVNEFLQINHSSSKFVFHDGLERYFVQVVDAETEEVVKEIPPRKLLDAFYEMQKLLGMIVDEKI
ncbi:flagellar protein FlaG [Lysinibacillus xylanilyticus]|uniref:flagellar protein FlaG n=1 Tax=Lysinibacillus xylanilyticus TaxID=582475 RepID=UPI00083C9699|nr:flagellar protein FlaG [Lysinibacillus xylanilyticus]